MVYCHLNSVVGGERGEPKSRGDVTKCQDPGLLLLQEMKGIMKDLSAKAKQIVKELKK